MASFLIMIVALLAGFVAPDIWRLIMTPPRFWRPPPVLRGDPQRVAMHALDSELNALLESEPEIAASADSIARKQTHYSSRHNGEPWSRADAIRYSNWRTSLRSGSARHRKIWAVAVMLSQMQLTQRHSGLNILPILRAVDRSHHGLWLRILRSDHIDAGSGVLVVQCPSTKKLHVMFAPSRLKTACEARAWTFGLTPKEFRQLAVET